MTCLKNGTSTGTNSTDKSTGEQVLYIGSAKADVELPNKFSVKIFFGAKASYIHVISDNVFEYLANGAYAVDPGKTNKFDYHENTQALYISAQKKLNKKWDAQAGLRGEYTQTRAESITLSQVNETQYFQLFPTGYIQYTANENNVFNLNYNRRIDRPNMVLLNPFRKYSTPNSYEAGNPFLQPSCTLLQPGAELYATVKIYVYYLPANYITQVSAQIEQVDTANKGFYFNYANIGTSLNYGVTASANVSPAEMVGKQYTGLWVSCKGGRRLL